MLFDSAAAADALEDLLEHERRLILSGHIGDLARSSREKEQLIARLAGANDGVTLARVRRLSERNQTLLTAAARGLKAARTRIANIAAGGTPMRTYDADGAARTLTDAKQKPGINHRA